MIQSNQPQLLVTTEYGTESLVVLQQGEGTQPSRFFLNGRNNPCMNEDLQHKLKLKQLKRHFIWSTCCWIILSSVLVASCGGIFLGFVMMDSNHSKNTENHTSHQETTNVLLGESLSLPPPETSRSLLLLRHAQSSWDVPSSMPDVDRPLALVGRLDAQRLGRYLARHEVPGPAYVYASPSVRTRETWQLVQDTWVSQYDSSHDKKKKKKPSSSSNNHPPPAAAPLEWDLELYNLEDYRAFVPHLDDQYHRILMVGHNPAIGAFANQLLAVGNSNHSVIPKFPPGTFCELTWNHHHSNNNSNNKIRVDRWKDILHVNATIRRLLTPQDTKK